MATRSGWENEVVMDGWIEKRGSRFHTWKRRWARLYMNRIEYGPESNSKISGCWYLSDYLNIAHERSRFSDRPNCLCLVHPSSDNRFFQPHKDIAQWIESIDAILHNCIPTILKTRRVDSWLDLCILVLRSDTLDPNIGSGEYEVQLLLEQSQLQAQSQSQTQSQAKDKDKEKEKHSPESHAPTTITSVTTLASASMNANANADEQAAKVDEDDEMEQVDRLMRDTLNIDEMSNAQLQWDRVSRIIPKDGFVSPTPEGLSTPIQAQTQEPLVEETVDGCATSSSQGSNK